LEVLLEVPARGSTQLHSNDTHEQRLNLNGSKLNDNSQNLNNAHEQQSNSNSNAAQQTMGHCGGPGKKDEKNRARSIAAGLFIFQCRMSNENLGHCGGPGELSP